MKDEKLFLTCAKFSIFSFRTDNSAFIHEFKKYKCMQNNM